MAESSRKRRGNSRYITFFILIIIGLAGSGWGGYQWLRSVTWLQIKKINVTGNENISTQNIQNLLQSCYGKNLLDISTREIASKLKHVKRIEQVKITRVYPATLKVKLLERKGFVYVKSLEGDLFPIDKQRMIIEHAVNLAKEDIPIVHTTYQSRQMQVGRIVGSPFVKQVIALQTLITEQRPDFLKSISEYYQQANSVYIVDANTGTRIILGQKDLNDQLRRYQFVQENGDIDKTAVLDLRFKNQVVVRPEVR
jgi:cell division protein FtsQ